MGMAGNLEMQGYTITPIPNPKRNPRRIYYRPRTGIPTLPLPADSYHQRLFLSKGFTLEPPSDEVVPAKRRYKHTRKFLKKQAQKIKVEKPINTQKRRITKMAFPSFEVLSPKTVDWSITHNEGTAAKSAYDAAFKLTTKNTLALTSGRLCGMSINVEPMAATDAYGVVGFEVSTYMQSDTTVSASVNGMLVKVQGGTSIAGDWYGLYVYSAPGEAPGSSSYVLRLEHNSAVTTDGFITFINGSTSPSFLFDCGPNATDTAWAYTGTKTGSETGWLKVQVGTNTRYIQLWTE